MGKLARLLLVVVVVLLGAVILAALLIPKMIDEKTLRELAQNTVREQIGGDLTINGPLGLSLLPAASIDLSEVSLLMPNETQPMFEARKASMALKIWPLLTGNVKIDGIALDGLALVLKSGTEVKPAISTDGMSDKQLDALYARQKAAREKAAKKAAQEAGQVAAIPVVLNAGSLVLTDATVTYIDEIAKSSTVVHVDELKASDLNAQGDRFPLTLSVTVNPEQADSKVQVKLEGSLALNAETRILGLTDMQINAQVAGMAPVTVTLGGEVDLLQIIANLNVKLNSDGVTGGGEVRYAANESPQIDARLKLNRLAPALLVLAGPEAAQQSAPSGSDSSDTLPLDAIRAIDSRVNLSVDKAEFDTLMIEQLALQARAKEGVITIKKLAGQIYGGALKANAVFNGRHNVARLSVKGQLAGLDLAQAVAAQKLDVKVSGKAGLTFDVSSAGKTVTALRMALNGPVSLEAPGAVVEDVAAEKMFCQAVAAINRESLTATFAEQTTFNSLSAQLQFADGKARLEPLTIATDYIGMRGTGELYLADLQFRARLRAALSTDLKEKDDACRINKRMENIEWPVRCKGELSGDPAKWCDIDSGDILEQVAKQEAKKKLQEEGGKLLKKLFGNDR